MPSSLKSASKTVVPPAGPAVEDGPVVGQHRGRITPARSGIFEGVNHVGGLGDPDDPGGHDRPGVVVDEVQDLDVGSVL